MDLTKSKQQAGDASNNLNLNVLQRKDPSIARIVETATHVVAYKYNNNLQQWV
jgi:hypothetical protein